MSSTVTLPVWLFALIVLFAAVAFASNFLFPSVRWFLRRRLERAVSRLNTRLERPIEPFKLLERQDTIHRLIYDRDVMEAIRTHARDNNLREDVVFQKARGYAREIVPSFSAFAYFGFAIRGARLLSNALYRVRMGRFDSALLEQIDPDATVIFVMNHRSNMDYVLVTYLAADRSALSYAVGEWARVWPLSRLIRAMGAYFIRRKSRDALYRAVLRRYVQLATENGVTQAIFPEGGLSLDGGVSPPKLGLLSYVTDGLDLSQRDVVFVPVALNYDRVLEDTVLIKAGQGGHRRFEARIGRIMRKVIKQLWLRVTGRFHRFGYAAVSFGAPVSLRAQGALPSADLAEILMRRISDIVPVLPVPLVAYLIDSRPSMTQADLTQAFGKAVASLTDVHVHLPRDDTAYAAEVGLRPLTQRGIVTETDGVLQVDQSKEDILRYYAQSIRHHFEPSSNEDSAPAA